MSNFSITLKKALLTHDTELMSKMDPFAQIMINGITKKTSVLKKVGSKPEWNEVLEFGNIKSTDTAKITVLDYETFSNDDVVGE